MILISGTVSNAAKRMSLDRQWQQKKNSGNPLSKKELNERENWTEDQKILAHFKEDLDRNKESEKLQGIMNKVAAGKELTKEEIAYLAQKNPGGLKAYQEIQAEKESYKREIKNCKTQEDVDRLRMTKMGEFAAAVKKIASDSCIPDSKKLEITQQILGKAKVVEEIHQEFVRSGQYAALPTEEEKKEESKEKTEKVTEQAEAVKENIDHKTENVKTEAADVSEEGAADGADDGFTDAVEPVSEQKELAVKKEENVSSYEDVKKAVVDFMKKKMDTEDCKGRKVDKKA